MKDLRHDLEQRKAHQLYRVRRVSEGPPGPELRIGGERLLAFCSNDYLGLANHPDVVRALQAGADTWGVGSGAAHLVSGHSAAHHALEEELADFVGRPRALLFSTGYMANLGVAGALLGPGDRLFEDRYNHASLLDAARYSGARLVRYAHADGDDLGRRLVASGRRGDLIATDGVFSMDGDLAPLPVLAAAARAAQAWLLVDDAHGLGVLGAEGRGSVAHCGLEADAVPILMGTLGKAFGTFGAFVAGSEDLIETLIQRARTYVYTTATPPALAEATRASLRLVRAESWRRERLQALIARFRSGAAQLGLQLMASETPIQPLLVGAADAAVRLSERLRARGILVPAIRPPTVPAGTARLRITFSAAHDEAQVDRLLEALEAVACHPCADRLDR
ncbi:MAG: 8-amino-7-oxononanoate synthase [Gammaproteobacteria bacterium]|nr:8-amino-7-oxononanoate synthase [Gammaproteobacteria bacterium]